MHLTQREWWTALHGMIFGAGFLLAFAASIFELSSLRNEWLTPEGARRGQRRLVIGTWAMVILAWATVIVGTYAVYPWYRAKPPKDMTNVALADYPRSLLLSKPQTAEWHTFGMEWKEHVGWFAPILATAVAVVVSGYRRQLLRDQHVRRALLFMLSVAFVSASIAGSLGAFLDKAAPTR